ncbi:PALE CRESS, chloroplastic [Olea europaea subsp. europaea]|uniref:PALE CRESS, chloroplastic n=1 Tax=Olea europaea subsp. europaea TaxID=158383 RepID=A0A8S0VB80_OLEEU|nr:PALE CRESS, chloroplastic [Olea europaea subsp. europaea]
MLQAPVTTLEVTTGITNDENVQLRLLSTVSTIIETSMTSDNHHYLSSCHPQPTGKSSQQGPWLELESSCVHINGDGDKSDDDYFANGSRQLLCGKEKLTFRPNCFIKSAEEVEEKIEEAAEKGELNELVLLIIWNRLDLARRDDEKDAVRSLDLLYRRVETEILKREATPAMRLLNDLLNLHDGFDDDGWLKACKKRMIDTFPREDPFSILVPAGFDIDKV